MRIIILKLIYAIAYNTDDNASHNELIQLC